MPLTGWWECELWPSLTVSHLSVWEWIVHPIKDHLWSRSLETLEERKAKRTQVKKHQVMLHYDFKKKKKYLTLLSCWNCSVLRAIPHVQFMWYGFEVFDETVTPCDCTPWQARASGRRRNQNNLLSPANTFFCRCVKFQEPRAPTSPTLECRCINMAGKQITCNLSRAGWGFSAVFKLSGALRRDYPKDKCFPLVARTPFTPTACRQQTHGERRRESRRMSHAARRLAGPAD